MNSPINLDSIIITDTGLNIEIKNPNEQRYECIICENNFLSLVGLTIHYVTHHQLKQCAKCPVIFETEDDLFSHLRTNHISEKCSICDGIFITEGELVSHYSSVHSRKKCDICDDFVGSPEEYANHLAAHHKILPNISEASRLYVKLREDLFFCRQCAFRYQFDEFIDHYLDYHQFSTSTLIDRLNARDKNELPSSAFEGSLDTKKLECCVCHQRYTSSIPKIVHKICCEGNTFCIHCKNIFQNRKDFNDHKLDSNILCSKEEASCYEDSCLFCGMSFESTNLCDHKLQTHLIENANVDLNSLFHVETRFKKKIYSCHLCLPDSKETFTHITGLVEHYLFYHKVIKQCILTLLASQDIAKLYRNNDQGLMGDFCSECPINNLEGKWDIDTRVVKFLYSSFEDLSSDETAPDEKYTFICALCDQKAVSKFALISHMNKVHGFVIDPFGFRCRICHRGYKSRRSLKIHHQNRHARTDVVLKCNFCPYESRRKDELRNHIQHHIEVTYHPCTSRYLGYNCRYCKYTSWTRNQLNDHMMSMHLDTVDKNFVMCTTCATPFSCFKSLRNHLKAKHPYENSNERFLFQCEICKINFPHIEDIRKHMIKVHPNYKTIFCSIPGCGHLGINGDALKDHVRRKHGSNRNLRCSSCYHNY